MNGRPARSTNESCQDSVNAMMRPAANCATACHPSAMRLPVLSWNAVAALVSKILGRNQGLDDL
eukprot:56279-Eustigmatos_ZCMA.PRE.1